jgi:hypothetical protein
VDGEVGYAAGGERGADQAKAQPVERSGRHGIGRARRLLPGLLLIALLLAGPPLLLGQRRERRDYQRDCKVREQEPS